jgi:hypothetical protein
VLLHPKQSIPEIKTNPVHKKPILGYDICTLHTYYKKNYVFIYDKSNKRLIASFQNVSVILINNDENENKLLFSLASKPDWNDNKDANYATITSKSTIQKVREICNNLYKLLTKDTDSKPTILVDKQVVAYSMDYPKFLYYKIVKSDKGVRWEKDGEIKLYNRSTKRKAKYKQKQEYIDDRYYLIGDQKVSVYGKPEERYYSIYDELRIYDLYKREIIETTSSSEILTYDYKNHKAFDGMGVWHGGTFLIEDRLIIRPVVFSDENVIYKIKIDNYNNKNEETVEITGEHDYNYYEPIMLLYSKGKCIFVTGRIIFIYDLSKSSNEPSKQYNIIHSKGGIDISRMKLHKYKNFLILFYGTHLIAAYYNRKDSQYYFKHGVQSIDNLHEFNVMGYLLSRDDNDECIGMLISSQKNEVIMIIYDSSKKEIYFSSIIKYNYLTARKRDIYSLSYVLLPRNIPSQFVVHFLINLELYNNRLKVTQKDNIGYLNAIIGKNVRVIRGGNGSRLPLSPDEFYSFKSFNYFITYEQPCLVKLIKHG